jgi:hypothetical protein
MKRFLLSAASVLVAAAVTVGLSSGEAQAIAFVNGGFETGVSTGWDLMNATNTPGWVINYGSGSNFPRLNLNQANGGPYGNNNQGKQFATIGATEDGGTSSLQQTVSGFTMGQTYTLTWEQSSEFTTSDVLNVSFLAGSSTASQDFASNPYPGGSDFWFGWQDFSMPFLADSSSVTFLFHSYGTNYEPGVDNFQIVSNNAVPEPGTLGLLGASLLGFGVLRRRRKTTA